MHKSSLSTVDVMLDLCQQLLGGESWIVVEIAIEESLIDAVCAVEKCCRRAAHGFPNMKLSRRTRIMFPDFDRSESIELFTAQVLFFE